MSNRPTDPSRAAAKVRRAIRRNAPPQNVAEAIFRAKAELRGAELHLEHLLDSLYGAGPDDWQDFDTETADRSVHVYAVIESDAAVDALMRAGFARVTQHDHSRERFMKCGCPTRSIQ